MKLKKNTAREETGAVKKSGLAALKRAELKGLWKSLPKTVLVAIAGVVAMVAATTAWFSSNRAIEVNNSSVNIETPSASLFVELGTAATTNYYSGVGKTADDKGLYPISTVDCKNWYYAAQWGKEVVSAEDGGNGIITRPIVTGYAAASAAEESNGDGLSMKYTAFGKTHTAYYKQVFNVYTDRESLDVYLSPDNPINIAYGEGVDSDADKATADKIKTALRIALTDSTGKILLYYVPEAESGKGNSKGTTADALFGVNGTAEDNAIALPNTITPYYPGTLDSIAAVYNSTNDVYETKAGSSKICSTTTTGVELHLYVWLEGTDAQALSEVTGGIKLPIQVILSLVGVEQAAASNT